MKRLRWLLFRQVLVRILGSVMQGILILLLLLDMGAVTFGIFGAILALGAYLSRVFNLGMPTRALRLASERDADSSASTLLAAQTLLSMPLGIVLVAVSITVFEASWTLTVMATALVVGDLLVEATLAVLLGRQLHSRAEIVMGFRRLTPLLGWVGGNAVDAAPAGLMLGVSCAVIVSLAVCLPTLGAPRGLVAEVRKSRPYWYSSLLSGVNGLDVFILALLGPANLAGWYAAASRTLAPLSLLTSSAVTLLAPKLATVLPAQRSQLFRRARRYTLLLAGGLGVVAPFLGLAIPTFLGEEFDGSSPLFAGFIALAGIVALGEVYSSLFVAMDNARALVRVRLISSPLHLGSVVLVMGAGPTGLGIAIVAASALHVMALHILAQRRWRV